MIPLGQVSVDWASVGPILGLGLVVLLVVLAFLRYLSEQGKIQAIRDAELRKTLDANSDATRQNNEVTGRMHEAIQELSRELRNGRRSR
ncbi:MAG: hypothetical protein ACRDH9_03045 [Actinomycetota bacterium]